MNIFGPSDQEKQLADARAGADDAEDRAEASHEALGIEQAKTADALARLAAVTLARDPAKMGALAIDAAKAIEDVFARGGHGVADRRAEIAAIVRGKIEIALSGGPAAV